MPRTPKRDEPGSQRPLNNNVIITVDEAGRERVLMGPGLGFKLKTAGIVDFGLVEKSFVLETATDSERAQTLLTDLPYGVVDAVLKAIEVAERQLGKSLGARLPLAVLDHMQYVVERMSTGLRLARAPMPELAILYPEECAAALAMVASMNESLGYDLPPEESVFLTMHLLNTTRDQAGASAAIQLRRVQHIVVTVENALGLTLDPSSSDYARFILHVQFLLQRLSSDSMLRGTDTAFYDYARTSYPTSFKAAEAVRSYIAASTETALTDEEVLYVCIHVERLSQRVAETGVS